MMEASERTSTKPEVLVYIQHQAQHESSCFIVQIHSEHSVATVSVGAKVVTLYFRREIPINTSRIRFSMAHWLSSPPRVTADPVSIEYWVLHIGTTQGWADVWKVFQLNHTTVLQSSHAQNRP
jgi:hypothetical protein